MEILPNSVLEFWRRVAGNLSKHPEDSQGTLLALLDELVERREREEWSDLLNTMHDEPAVAPDAPIRGRVMG